MLALALIDTSARPDTVESARLRREAMAAAERDFPGVVEADTYLTVGETIRPVRLDGDRRGYVIAIGETSVEALERAESAATLLDVEVEPT